MSLFGEELNYFERERYYNVSRLAYTAWKCDVRPLHSSPEISSDDIRFMLENEMVLNPSTHLLPRMRKHSELPRRFSVQAHENISETGHHPDLLIAAIAALSEHIARESFLEPDDTIPERRIQDVLIGAFRGIDFITHRNALRRIANASIESAAEEWSVLACKPLEEGPIFFERLDDYEKNMGTIGHLFEDFMKVKPSDCLEEGRIISTANIAGKVKVILTSSFDSLDPTGRYPIEMKTKPMWAKKMDLGRHLSAWIQSALSGINTIITGSFTAERGNRTGPVEFQTAAFETQSLEEYGSVLPADTKKKAFQLMAQVLIAFKKIVGEVGTVYRIRRDADGRIVHSKFSQEESQSFPITATVLRNCAEACLALAEERRVAPIPASAAEEDEENKKVEEEEERDNEADKKLSKNSRGREISRRAS